MPGFKSDWNGLLKIADLTETGLHGNRRSQAAPAAHCRCEQLKRIWPYAGRK